MTRPFNGMSQQGFSHKQSWNSKSRMGTEPQLRKDKPSKCQGVTESPVQTGRREGPCFIQSTQSTGSPQTLPNQVQNSGNKGELVSGIRKPFPPWWETRLAMQLSPQKSQVEEEELARRWGTVQECQGEAKAVEEKAVCALKSPE